MVAAAGDGWERYATLRRSSVRIDGEEQSDPAPAVPHRMLADYQRWLAFPIPDPAPLVWAGTNRKLRKVGAARQLSDCPRWAQSRVRV